MVSVYDIIPCSSLTLTLNRVTEKNGNLVVFTLVVMSWVIVLNKGDTNICSYY